MVSWGSETRLLERPPIQITDVQLLLSVPACHKPMLVTEYFVDIYTSCPVKYPIYRQY